jgi:predicted house-cleaning noncanonical NTP pyrophosphatase (MazG superfamily)
LAEYSDALLASVDPNAEVSLSSDETLLLQSFLVEVGNLGSTQGRVLVRSNAITEDLSQRGRFRSLGTNSSLSDVLTAVASMVRENRASPMRPILQPAIEPAIVGHMSNERRVSQFRDSWLVEWSSRPSDILLQQRLRARQAQNWPSILAARTEAEVNGRLRLVAGYLKNTQCRWHCEWVWDGTRVWIVQVDSIPSTALGEADSYLLSSEAWSPDFEPAAPQFVHFSSLPSQTWKKLRRPKTFLDAGLPSANVFVLPANEWLEGSSSRQMLIEADLKRLLNERVVIRTDIADSIPHEDLLLPTSPATKDFQELVRYMRDAACWFEKNGIPPSSWAYLFAYLVPARASAMVHAYPAGRRVRVDAIWGYPDGLLYLAHDSYFYDTKTHEIITKKRYKGTCLLAEGDGWIPMTVGTPLDWAPTLNNDEVQTLAQWGLRLSNHLNHEIQLMALAKIAGIRGPSACLPWHYNTLTIPTYRESLESLPLAGNYIEIRNEDDLNSLANHAASDLGKIAIRIKPDPTLLRSAAFLRQTAATAARLKLPLLCEGSLLAHAYYIMDAEGATVIPITTVEPPSASDVHHKIVRDNIPVIIEQAGSLARVTRVDRAIAGPLLAQKLIEEAFEVFNAPREALSGELCDVLDVVDALREHAGISAELLERRRDQKNQERGGFSRLIYLVDAAHRSLREADKGQGALPLLGDDVTFPQRHSLKHEPLKIETPSGTDIILRCHVSLIPAVSGAGPLPSAARALSGFRVLCEYKGSSVVLTIRGEPEQRKPTDQHQFELFAEDRPIKRADNDG